MKKRTVQILYLAISLCLLLTIALISITAFAEDNSFVITEKVLTDKNTVWKYLDNNTDPADGYDNLNAWTDKDFNDSAWKSASGSFGNKSGSLQTIFIGSDNGFTPSVLINLNDGTSGSGNYKTYFFRTKVTVDSLDDLYAFSVELNADDAAVVYFNGKIVIDTRVTVNDTTNLYYSSSTKQIYRYWFDADEAKEFLSAGENTVAVALHNSDSSSSDVLFDFSSSLFYSQGSEPYGFDDVVMSVGSGETERNLTWYTRSADAGEIQVAKAEDMRGDEFPDTYSIFNATTTRAANSPGEYTNKATITGLIENTEYVYRLKCGSRYSQIYSFKTESFESFDVVVFGDPQIRSWTDTLATPDYVYWNDTIEKISKNFSADLYVSAGDQVNVHDEERDYAHLITEHLASTPLAPTYGNHENGSTIFNDHYNLPNHSSTLNANYWFTYNNVLFININNFVGTTDKHLAFVEEAVTLNPNCEWRILTMHYSPFSGGSHSNSSAVKSYRDNFVPHLNDLGIDIVIGGHDHVYARSYLMDGNTVAADQSNTDSDGVLYICAGSAGGKFYDPITNAEGSEAIAFSHDDHSKTVVHLEINKNSISLVTYLVDDMSVIDTYTLSHSDQGRLSDAVAKAESILLDAEKTVSESMLTSIKSAIADASAALENINSYSPEEIDALITLLGTESSSLSEAVVNYNKLSVGAKTTNFDTTSYLNIVHLEDGGVYSLSGRGSKAVVSLIKHNSDGTTETVYTWKEGATWVKRSTTNPYVAFILDGDVTFNSTLEFEYTNLLIDLKGHSITFETSGSYNINVMGASSIEFRGEGKIIANTGTVTYFLSTAQYIASMTLNGNITFVDGTANLKKAFFFRGDAFVYGTLTIDKSFDTSTGVFFGVQGSRSSADNRNGIILIEDATINYNNPKGGALFSAKGISGVSSTSGTTYTSIPEVNIINSTLNLSSPMITSTWGLESVSGYGASKSDALTNCVNATALNITDSYIYADIKIAAPVTISPSGHTTINITRSTFYSERGVIIKGIASNTITLNATDSSFFAGTTNTESTSDPQRGEVLYTPAKALGTATFNNCSLTAAYRVIEGSSDSLEERTYTTSFNDCSLSLTNDTGCIFTRINVVFNNGYINCGVGNVSYKATPYNSDTGKGLLITGTVKICNFSSSGLDDEVKTIAEYEELYKSDSAVYDTVLTSGYFTVANDYNVLKLDDPANNDGRYTFLLYSDDHTPMLTLHEGTAPTCTQTGTKDYYTCFCGLVYADAEGNTPVENPEEWIPIAALGHTEEIISGKAATCTEAGLTEGKKCSVCDETLVAQTTISAIGHTEGEWNIDADPTCTAKGSKHKACTVCGVTTSTEEIAALGHTAGTEMTENNVAPTCTAEGSYDTVVYCTVCSVEISRVTTTVSAIGHTAGEGSVKNNVAPTCTAEGSYDTVIYCSVCNTELSRTHTDVSALGHTEEIISGKAATCTEAGLTEGKKCSVCDEVLVAQTTISATGHTDGEAITENVVASTCTANGSYDTVKYCTVCSAETSRETITTETLGHTDGEAITENVVAPTCTAEGSYDNVVYCTVCGGELSRETFTTSALGHNFGEWVANGDGTHTRVCKNNSDHTESRNCYGGTATADSRAICSACGGEYGDLKEVVNNTNTPEVPSDTKCDHICHSDNAIIKLLWNIINFFMKLFGMNDTCPCGTKHF